MLAVVGGERVCVGVSGVRSHGRVKLEMFENSGLALRFFFLLFLFLFLFTNRLFTNRSLANRSFSKPLG